MTKVKICEIYEISGMQRIVHIMIYENTSILSINVAQMNMIASKMYLQASITNNEKRAQVDLGTICLRYELSWVRVVHNLSLTNQCLIVYPRQRACEGRAW